MSDKCSCGDYKPYGETIPKGSIMAPVMPMDWCVNCHYKPIDENKLDEALETLRQAMANDVKSPKLFR